MCTQGTYRNHAAAGTTHIGCLAVGLSSQVDVLSALRSLDHVTLAANSEQRQRRFCSSSALSL